MYSLAVIRNLCSFSLTTQWGLKGKEGYDFPLNARISTFKVFILCFIDRGQVDRTDQRWRTALLIWKLQTARSQPGGKICSGRKRKTVENVQSWARDNVTTKILAMAQCLFSWRLLHLDTETLTFFIFFSFTEALLCCRVVVVEKLKNWRVPSSVIF